MCALRDTIDHVARGEAKVLITGESGVGKDLVARCIHARSPRRAQSFVAVNCAAFTETLLESELFGHVRGSFTGAYRDKIGKLQLAHNGTVFLDEVGEMSLRMQALLLRFLENGELQPVGSDQPTRTVNVRVVAATNRDLADLIAAGQFREDLMYRLKVVHIRVAPLRERREDVRPLVASTIARTGRAAVFSEDALQALERYRWPGNVRELQNVVEQIVWMAKSDVIELEQLPAVIRSTDPARATPTRERRRQLADDLFAGLQSGQYQFWVHVHALFLNRDITRHDLRELVDRGLAATGGNYRAVLRLFGLPDSDYKRFLNFLAAHQCAVDFRPFRAGVKSNGFSPWNPLAAVSHPARAAGDR
jgi:transcriptional regulator with PAS, ATPase and Fis domain